MNRRRFKAAPLSLRLVAQGTRVVSLRDAPLRVAGVISHVRSEPHLKSYVVTCDGGEVAYASGYDIAREDDLSLTTPLGPLPEY